mmetsp:Transcript_36533/g.65365  ORF Transcript_36533/g.65365 Transcript_36533/m.65365 type:complete len:80 (+) Transcript_36533:807-1046(+)
MFPQHLQIERSMEDLDDSRTRYHLEHVVDGWQKEPVGSYLKDHGRVELLIHGAPSMSLVLQCASFEVKKMSCDVGSPSY